MHQCTLHTMHQWRCCYVLLSSAAPLICYQRPALRHSAQHSQAGETVSNQHGLEGVCTLSHLTISPSHHLTKHNAVSFESARFSSYLGQWSGISQCWKMLTVETIYNINYSICWRDEASDNTHSASTITPPSSSPRAGHSNSFYQLDGQS